MKKRLFLCDHCGVCVDQACVSEFRPYKWEGRLETKSENARIALVGSCHHNPYTAEAYLYVNIENGISEAEQLEMLYRHMETFRPYEEKGEDGYTETNIVRTDWYKAQDCLGPHEKDRQFLDMFSPAHRPTVRRWLEENHGAGQDKLHQLRERGQELFCAVVERARKCGDMEAADKIMDYMLPSVSETLLRNEEDKPITNYLFDFSAFIVEGSSEGIYLNCYLQGEYSDQVGKLRIGTFKTLKNDVAAYKVMGELCGVLTYHAGIYVNEHLDRFTPDQELKRRYGEQDVGS